MLSWRVRRLGWIAVFVAAALPLAGALALVVEHRMLRCDTGYDITLAPLLLKCAGVLPDAFTLLLAALGWAVTLFWAAAVITAVTCAVVELARDRPPRSHTIWYAITVVVALVAAAAGVLLVPDWYGPLGPAFGVGLGALAVLVPSVLLQRVILGRRPRHRGVAE